MVESPYYKPRYVVDRAALAASTYNKNLDLHNFVLLEQEFPNWRQSYGRDMGILTCNKLSWDLILKSVSEENLVLQ